MERLPRQVRLVYASNTHSGGGGGGGLVLMVDSLNV